jgi:ATP-dependent Clp protease adapter protein ClpS
MQKDNKRPGYFKVAQIGGVGLLVHWSLPVGGAIVAAFVHANPKQWVFFCLAYLFLVIIHEAGHVLAALAVRLRVFTIEISGIGGLCRIERPRCIRHSVFVYTAGLLAQALVLSITLAYVGAFGSPGSPFGAAIVFTFTVVNVVIFVVNLIPQRSARSGVATDGLVLWRLFLHVFRGHPHPHPPLIAASADQSPIFSQETSLLKRPGFRSPGFVHGIEILNDRTTPMEFVVTTLVTHLGLTREQAIVKMLDIHNTGGALIALQSAKEAQRIADAVSAEARASGHSFVCRYAGAAVLED